MTRTERALLDLLKPRFAGYGFKFLAKRELFIRKTTYGFDKWLWTKVPTGAHLELGLVIGVRHDKVEDLVNQLETVHGQDNQRYTSTLIHPLAVFPPATGRSYTKYLNTERDLPRVAAEMVEILQLDALPFYAKYGSLEACAHGLNTPVESLTHPLYNNFERRAYYGLACAWLTKRPDFDDLLARYRAYTPTTRQRWELTMENVDRLLGILRRSAATSA